MAEPVALPYGHTGQPTYHSADRQWTFERLPDTLDRFQLVGQAKLVKSGGGSSGNIADSDSEVTEGNSNFRSIRYPKQIQDLTSALPELRPATSVLHEHIHLSEAAHSAIDLHDPSVGSLISLGQIGDKKSRKTVRAVAFPHGSCGSNLCLMKVETVRSGWSDSHASHLRVSGFGGQETSWVGSGAPIQQVVFSQAIAKNEVFLAVRLPTAITVFRPRCRLDGSFSQSSLQLNPIIKIHVQESQDVVFNPFYARQLATINRHTQWSVHELAWHQGARGKTYSSKVICTGSVLTAKAGTKHVEDGWSRINWLGDPAMICSCSRYSLCCYDISSGSPLPVAQLEFVSPACDIAQILGDFNTMITLTTTHIYIYHTEIHKAKVSLRLALEIRHYRNDEDVTLRLSVLTEDNVLRIMIRSDLNRFVDVYRVKKEDTRYSLLVDPIRLPVPLNLRLADIQLQPVEYRINQSTHGHAGTYQNLGIQFYEALVLDRDAGVHQILYAATPRNKDTQVSPPDWTSGKSFSNSIVGADDFVVDSSDNDESNHVHDQSQNFDWHAARQDGSHKLDWKVNLEHVADEVAKPPSDCDSTIDDIAAQIEKVLHTTAPDTSTHLATIAEIAGRDVLLNDIEDASARLEGLLLYQPESTNQEHESSEVPYPHLAVQRLSLPRIPCFELLENDRTLSGIYSSLLEEWIIPLPTETPGRLRVAQERLVRRAAVDLTMASHVVSPSFEEDVEPPSGIQPKPSLETAESQFELPFRAPIISAPSGASTPSIYHDATSRATTPAPSFVTTSTTFSTATDIARLSRYTSFETTTNPLISATTLPRSLHHVLAHWTVGSDPDTYDWADMTRAVSRAQEAADDEDEAQGLSPRERERLRRRAERHLKRERREAAASQQALLQSSQVVAVAATRPSNSRSGMRIPAGPFVVPASSPLRGQTQTQMSDRLGSQMRSSVEPGTPLAASQVVPGRFGGRPSLGTASKKRKRKSGF